MTAPKKEWLEDAPRSIPIIPAEIWYCLPNGKPANFVSVVYFTIPPKVGDHFHIDGESAKTLDDSLQFCEWVIKSIAHEFNLNDVLTPPVERFPVATLKVVVQAVR